MRDSLRRLSMPETADYASNRLLLAAGIGAKFEARSPLILPPLFMNRGDPCELSRAWCRGT